jgi:hypothetical protein
LLDNYTRLCTIEADLSQAVVTRPKAEGEGNFYRVDYDIILLFGMTELKAQIAWKVNVSGLTFIVPSILLIYRNDSALVFREKRNDKF